LFGVESRYSALDPQLGYRSGVAPVAPGPLCAPAVTRPALPTVSLACARAARFTGLATHLRSVAECVPTSAFAPLAFARPLAGAASFAATYLDIIGFPALVEAITEYEERATPAAKFVVAMDRFHPILMDYLSEGAHMAQPGHHVRQAYGDQGQRSRIVRNKRILPAAQSYTYRKSRTISERIISHSITCTFIALGVF